MSRKTAWYTRTTIPDFLRDTAKWPNVDVAALELHDQERLARNRAAIEGYLEGKAVARLETDFGIRRSEILRQLNRCVAPHSDGRPYGWRALIPYLHQKRYTRLQAVMRANRGMAGAFHQFLRDHSALHDALDWAILAKRRSKNFEESRFSHHGLYRKFRELCRKEEISHTQYPLNTTDHGQRALRRYAKGIMANSFARDAQRLGGETAASRAGTGTGDTSHLVAATPFDLVSMDAHRLDFVGTILIEIAGRIEAIPIKRFQLLLLVEHWSTCPLGYHIAITQEANATDAVLAVKSALSVWEPRSLILPGHSYPPSAMLPSGAMAEAAGLAWNCLLLDNASIHEAHPIAEGVRQRVGCAVNFGPVHQWSRRGLMESVFSALVRQGFHRLPNTTGSGPADPLRPHAARNAVAAQMSYEELLDLVDVALATWAARSRDDLGYTSPLEKLCEAIRSPDGRWLPRYLPPLPAYVADLDVHIITKSIRGSVKEGRRPFVHYQGANYTNEILANASGLIGSQVRLHIRDSDLRTVRAFLPNGEELGVLTANSKWNRTPHDLRLRKAVKHAERDEGLIVPEGTDAVGAFIEHKYEQVKREHLARKPGTPKISKAATELARAQHVTGKKAASDRKSAPPAESAPRTSRTEVRWPIFLPRVSHKGGVK